MSYTIQIYDKAGNRKAVSKKRYKLFGEAVRDAQEKAVGNPGRPYLVCGKDGAPVADFLTAGPEQHQVVKRRTRSAP